MKIVICAPCAGAGSKRDARIAELEREVAALKAPQLAELLARLEAIAAPVEEARTAVQEQPVAHQDETGWHEGIEQGRKARAWLWVAVTALVTVYRIARSAETQVFKVLAAPRLRGVT